MNTSSFSRCGFICFLVICFLIVYRGCILDWTFAGSDFIGNDLRNWYFYIYTFERFFGKRNSIIGYMICHKENIDNQCMNVIYIYNAPFKFLGIKIAYCKKLSRGL